MRFGRRAETVLPPEPSPPPKLYRVHPEFVITGPDQVVEDDGIVEIDITGIPSGVTSVRLVSGAYSVGYPIDLDGIRVRHPGVTSIRLGWPGP